MDVIGLPVSGLKSYASLILPVPHGVINYHLVWFYSQNNTPQPQEKTCHT